MTMLDCSSKIHIDRKIAKVAKEKPSRKTASGLFSATGGVKSDSSTIFCLKTSSGLYIFLDAKIFIYSPRKISSMEYELLLKRAREKLPQSVFEKERFEIPKVRGHLEGNKTIITNFSQIASVLRRPTDHLLKYVLKELATPGEISRSGLLVLGAKIAASKINDKIKQYAHEFVLCTDCGKPDTEIKKEGDFSFLKCSACGSKHPVKSKI